MILFGNVRSSGTKKNHFRNLVQNTRCPSAGQVQEAGGKGRARFRWRGEPIPWPLREHTVACSGQPMRPGMSVFAPTSRRFMGLILLISLAVAAHGAPSKVKIGTCAPLYPPFVMRSWSGFTGLEVRTWTRTECTISLASVRTGVPAGPQSRGQTINHPEWHEPHTRIVPTSAKTILQRHSRSMWF